MYLPATSRDSARAIAHPTYPGNNQELKQYKGNTYNSPADERNVPQLICHASNRVSSNSFCKAERWGASMSCLPSLLTVVLAVCVWSSVVNAFAGSKTRG